MHTVFKFIFVFFFFFLSAFNSHAGIVTNTNDSGPGSLRDVITNAVSGEVVSFSPSLLSGGSATITLSTQITISVPLTINGMINGADTLYISGADLTRVFFINFYGGLGSQYTVYLNDLVVIRGKGANYGGGVYSNGGHLELNNCVFRNCTGDRGGAIYMIGGNASYIYVLTVNNSTFSFNSVTSQGGAVYISDGTSTNSSATGTFNNTTFNGNSATGGSAVCASSSVLSANYPGSVFSRINLNQCTITGNSDSFTYACPIRASSQASNNSSSSAAARVYCYNTTIYGNSNPAAYSLYANGTNTSTVYARSSIVEGKVWSTNLNVVTSQGYNIFFQNPTGMVASDQAGTVGTVNLGPLQFNGGNTKTRVPGASSIAIDSGSPGTTPDAQNGPIFGVRDVGSAEYNPCVTDNQGPNPDVANLPAINAACEVTSLTAPTATDVCTGSITGTHNTSLPITSSTTITWTYTDGSGNTTTQTQNVVISDNTAPVADLASLPELNAECAISSLTAPTATDNCAGAITGTHNATLPITSSTTVTWTYDDGNGNTSTQTQSVVISDVTAPVANVASLPAINAECSISSLTAPTATDNCAGTVTGAHNATLPITASTTITWTYDDGSGNTSTQTQSVVINDVTSPVPDQASLITLTSNCSQAITVLTAPTATDNCAGTITGTHNASLPITSSTTITWTFDDGNGNTSTQTQSVIINPDNTAPVADQASLAPVTAQCQITSLASPTATDNCAGTIVGTPNVTFPITTQGSFTITWTYNDGNGNMSTQTQSITIDDNIAPVANNAVLTNINAQCQVTSLTAPTATDNCAGTVTGTHNATLPITAPGTTVVTWTYNDGNGNTSTQTQNVVINDNIAPVPNTANLADVSAQCEVTSLIAPTATDNCAGTITGTHNATLPITAPGTTVVTWTYSDGNGNTFTQTQNVVINDNTAPVPNTANLADVSAQCEVTSLTAPTATDNCAGTITGTHNATLPITAPGTTVVTWTYNDGNGNTSTQTQNVVINDNTAPVPNTANLANVSAQCEVTSLTAPTATDNCAGTITGTHNVTLPITAQGTTVVTWTYDDGNGNTSTQTQNVVINDNTAPVADAASLSAMTSECEVTPTAPTATDNCAGTITGTPDMSFPITAAGTTTITWTYDDGNGNTSTQTQDVIITPIENSLTQVDDLTLSANAVGYTYQWVDCDNGNAPINGATSQTFTATENGNYAVEISNGSCSVLSDCAEINSVGLDELHNASHIAVYPNPASDVITIESTALISALTLTNALGQMVVERTEIHAKELTLQLPEEPGVYFLNVQMNGQNQTIRVSKK